VFLGLASGSSISVVTAVMEQTQLSDFFKVIVSTEDVARGKPHPDVLIEAARRLGARPSTCVVVEDALYGVVAARRAGMRCIAVPSLADQALLPEFAAADLLFPRGIADFKADTAFTWIERLGSHASATD